MIDQIDFVLIDMNPDHIVRPLQNATFCPISAPGSIFNSRNILYIPVVKTFDFLELEQKLTFFKGLIVTALGQTGRRDRPHIDESKRLIFISFPAYDDRLMFTDASVCDRTVGGPFHNGSGIYLI